jgi:hypothetical protein
LPIVYLGYPDDVKWALGIACMLAGAPARADSNDADDRNEATRLFEEGRKLKDAGDLAGACTRFEQSYALDKAAGTALNLGACAEVARDWWRAWALYDAAATTFLKHSDSRARFARSRADLVLAAHPEVEVGSTPPPLMPVEDRSVYVTKQQDWRLGLKILAGSSFAIVAIGAVLWIDANERISDFRGGSLIDFQGNPIQFPDDCGVAALSAIGDEVDRFETACDAHDRKAVIVPVTIATALIGTGALVAVFATKPERVRVVPIASAHGAGVSAVFRW